MPRLVPIALNQGATLLFGILGIKLVSHIVPKTVYGSYGLFLTLTQVGLLLTHSGVINHASRYWQREQSRSRTYARFLLEMTGRKSLLLALLLGVASLGMALSEKNWVWLSLGPFLFVGNLGLAVTNLGSLVLNASERHWRVFALNSVASAARSLLPVGTALALGATLFVLSGGFALHVLPVLIALPIVFYGVARSEAAPESLRTTWLTELRDFGRPFILIGAAGWFLQNADRWIVAALFGKEQAGLFNLASNIAGIIPNMVSAGLMQRVFPTIFRQADRARTEQDWARLARKCDWVTGALLALTVGGLLSAQLVSPWLKGWLIDNAYGPSLRLLLPAGMAALSLQANQFQYLVLQGQHDSSAMVRVMLVLATVRTLGSIVTGLISWPLFLGWLMVSGLVVAGLGRFLIQRRRVANLKRMEASALAGSL